MARKPTIRDVAKAAGVGPATVDRALHGRGNVSERSLKAIAEAAERLGFEPAGLSRLALSSEKPEVRLGFVLHKRDQAFYRNFAAELERACAAQDTVRVIHQIRFSPSQSPEDFANAIRTLADTSDAVAATSVNHPTLTRLAEEVRASGVPLFSLLNDFAGSAGAGYFGLDNMKAGRIAGWMMATRVQSPARVAVFVGGTRWHGQMLRETGFRTYLRENAPHLTMTDTVINLETRQLTYEATLNLLDRHDDLAGLYVAGGGMEGAIAALRERRGANRVALIVNELTEESRAALIDRYALMVIATPLETLCRALVDRMILAKTSETPLQAQRIALEPKLYTPESF